MLAWFILPPFPMTNIIYAMQDFAFSYAIKHYLRDLSVVESCCNLTLILKMEQNLDQSSGFVCFPIVSHVTYGNEIHELMPSRHAFPYSPSEVEHSHCTTSNIVLKHRNI